MQRKAGRRGERRKEEGLGEMEAGRNDSGEGRRREEF